MIGFIGISLQLQSIITARKNVCLRFASFLTGLRVSSLPSWRMPNEESLANEFCWAFSRVLHFITSREPDIDHHLEELLVILLLFILSVATKHRNLLLSNGVPTVDCVTSRMCLPKRCLAMDYSGFQASCHIMFKHIKSLFTDHSTVFGQLTKWTWVVIEKPQSLSYSRIPERLMERDGSVPYTQEPSTGPYPESHRTSPYHAILSLFLFA
jgi:hypothetical protein